MSNTKAKPPGVQRSRHEFPDPILYSPDKLLFDPRNPRLAQLVAEMPEELSQLEILKILWREMAVDEILLSIAQNGFFPYEPLFAVREGGNLYVIEGNRRLAAVKLLRDPKLRKAVRATDVPTPSDEISKSFEKLPVIVCERADVWQSIGFKHVNGPQTWQSYSKAHYIAWVHNSLGVRLADIAGQIGDRHSTVQRLFRGLMVLEQAEREGVFHRSDGYMKHFAFSHLYTGLDYSGIQDFIGISNGLASSSYRVPAEKFENLGRLLRYLYGSKSEDIRPVVRTQNPDLKKLGEVLESEEGIIALERGLPLDASIQISRGDERLFKEAIQQAKQALQQARGTTLTGYKGAVQQLEEAKDIQKLIDSIVSEMVEIFAKHEPGVGKKKTKTRRNG